MMIHRKVVRCSAIIVAILGLTLSVSPVVASELTLPTSLSYDGLTFDSGITVTPTEVLPTPVLSFLPEDVIEVTGTPKEEALPSGRQVLAENIIAPSSTEDVAESAFSNVEIIAEVVPSPTPTAIPTPTPQTSLTTPTNSSLPFYATNGHLDAEVLFSMANQKRAENGLPAFEKQADVCAVAESRKPEIENEVYGTSSIHAGFRARTLPWRATENMISQNTEVAAFNWWMNSPIHRAAILGTAKYACVACQNKTCSMIFSSLIPK